MKRRKLDVKQLPAKAAGELDDRFQLASPLRKVLTKVFPDHWSFLLGEIALFSFIVLLLTGTFLALFFDPSMTEVHYEGAYAPLRGIEMSKAYESSLNLSFDVRGGLILRQMHHWAALLFMAAIVVHMGRTFFTGAFRKPRETNWLIGVLLFWLGFAEGFIGYSLPDDALSGTGLRIAGGIAESIPLVGSWVSFALFGGEFPGDSVIPMFYILHVFLLPGLLLALIGVHVGLVFIQKHTQWPGPKRTEHNVIGYRMFPNYVSKQGGFFMLVFAVIALMAGLFQINPIWMFGPYRAEVVSAGSQPDFYVMFLDGIVRLFPAWEIRAFGFTVPAVFWPGIVGMGLFTMLPLMYPFLERRFTKDKAHHNLLQRPRDVPARAGVGAMALAFFIICTLSGANDIIADKFNISLNAMTWGGRIGLLVVPPLAYLMTYRICLGLQQHDREVLAHGVETGIIKRDADGRFYEVHQPLAQPDEHGHTSLEYNGWTVPKKMNRLGALAPTLKGFFKPIEQPAPKPEADGEDGEVGDGEKREEITAGK
ncbi:cytochrome bc1 complex cytochrome b subunit [Phytomonospora endophytica]|uniref:Cytochrome bc1 complex cytochrome b subunit n=1 Tax=Phytomonospora endophytica TaxID=714109 RepID=A0A841FS65_9ACTN|nr:cytochrome bc complex cytochrome b subunit [Phytomonospora endophytica]MBB6034810.1 ubiquinol-cytochrome c reductase cytochrome b subunit [Phytomonospora endophytica]GIG68987.1 ubiquinol-cytochrome c reductase cytochrome b subunit [Phytomonospora endophytica]